LPYLRILKDSLDGTVKRLAPKELEFKVANVG
jgi:hypothetical protein